MRNLEPLKMTFTATIVVISLEVFHVKKKYNFKVFSLKQLQPTPLNQCWILLR